MAFYLFVAMIFGFAISKNVLCENKETFETEITSYEDARSSECKKPCNCTCNDSNSNATVKFNHNLTAGEGNLENVSKCCSSPGKVNDNFEPRLGDEITMTVYSDNSSPHCFTWYHNIKLIYCSDLMCSSSITVSITKASDFGEYTVDMKQGNKIRSSTFHVLAYGPPEPVSHLNLSIFSTTSVLLSFLTGYNYNSTQTFIIVKYIDGYLTVLSSYLDTTSGVGGEKFTCAVNNLSEGTLYNISVISNNSRGESQQSYDFVTFTTYEKPMLDPTKPMNDTFEKRLQNYVTISVYAEGYPPPTYEWWHNGGLLPSSDSNYTSTVTFKIGNCKAFGQYILNMTNSVGSFSKVFEVLADGPPAAVRQFQVTNITQSSASLFFISGYDYNDTQSFVVRNFSNGKSADLKSVTRRTHDDGETPIIIHLDGLEPYARYNITVVANNSRGESEPADAFVYFRTLGGKPDSPNWCKIALDSPEWCIVALGTAAGFVVFVVVVVVIVIVCLKCRTSRTGMSAPLLEEDDMSSDEDTEDGSLSGRGADAQTTNGAVPGSRLNQTQNDETKLKSA